MDCGKAALLRDAAQWTFCIDVGRFCAMLCGCWCCLDRQTDVIGGAVWLLVLLGWTDRCDWWCCVAVGAVWMDRHVIGGAVWLLVLFGWTDRCDW